MVNIRILLMWFLIISGLVVVIVCGIVSLHDYALLKSSYKQFHDLSRTNADMRLLYIAYSMQNIHRINLFADGVWALLGGIISSIGLTGMCFMTDKNYPPVR